MRIVGLYRPDGTVVRPWTPFPPPATGATRCLTPLRRSSPRAASPPSPSRRSRASRASARAASPIISRRRTPSAAMIERFTSRFDAAWADLAARDAGAARPQAASLCPRVVGWRAGASAGPSTRLAAASQRHLRTFLTGWRRCEHRAIVCSVPSRRTGSSPVVATILRLAVDGLWLAENFNLARFEPGLKERVVERLLAWTRGTGTIGRQLVERGWRRMIEVADETLVAQGPRGVGYTGPTLIAAAGRRPLPLGRRKGRLRLGLDLRLLAQYPHDGVRDAARRPLRQLARLQDLLQLPPRPITASRASSPSTARRPARSTCCAPATLSTSR